MRQGEVDYFGPDGKPYRPETVPLNAEGREQAAAAARELAAVPLDRVVASGLRRSVETAALAIGPRPLTAENRPDLREIETGKLSRLRALSPRQVEDAFLCAPTAR